MIALVRKNIVKAILIKEFRQIFRDNRMRGILFGAPVLMLIVFGFAVSTDINEVHLVIQDDDKSYQSRALIGRITSSGYFKVYAQTDDPKSADELVTTGKAEAYLHIPLRFEKKIYSLSSVTLGLVVDGTDPNRGAVISGYLNTIIGAYSNSLAASYLAGARLSRASISVNKIIPVRIIEKIYYNENLTSRTFFLPCLLALLIGLITIMLTSMSIVKERESGTMEQILVTPIRAGEYIIGKTVPFALVSFFDTILLSLMIIFAYDIPFRGNYLFLLLCGIVFIIANLGVGIYISTVSRTQQQAMLSSFLFFLPSILLSGFLFPISSMPYAVQLVTYLNPMRYYVEIVRNIFLKGQGIAVLYPNVLLLFVLGAVFIYLSSRRFKRGIE